MAQNEDPVVVSERALQRTLSHTTLDDVCANRRASRAVALLVRERLSSPPKWSNRCHEAQISLPSAGAQVERSHHANPWKEVPSVQSACCSRDAAGPTGSRPGSRAAGGATVETSRPHLGGASAGDGGDCGAVAHSGASRRGRGERQADRGRLQRLAVPHSSTSAGGRSTGSTSAPTRRRGRGPFTRSRSRVRRSRRQAGPTTIVKNTYNGWFTYKVTVAHTGGITEYVTLSIHGLRAVFAQNNYFPEVASRARRLADLDRLRPRPGGTPPAPRPTCSPTRSSRYQQQHADPVRPDHFLGRRWTRRWHSLDRVAWRLHDLRRGWPVGREHQRDQRRGRRRSRLGTGTSPAASRSPTVTARSPPWCTSASGYRSQNLACSAAMTYTYSWDYPQGRRFKPGVDLVLRGPIRFRASRLSGGRRNGAAERAVPLRADPQCEAHRSRGRRQRLRLQRRPQGVHEDVRGATPHATWASAATSPASS